jgi:hypothetical protein
VHLRVRLQVELEGAKAADHVLRGVGAVDSQDEDLGPLCLERLLRGAHHLAPCEPLELGRVDRDGTEANRRRAPAERHLVGGKVDLRVRQVGAAPEEVRAPAARVEADDVVREQALVDRTPDAVGQHGPVVGLRPRDVDEVGERRLGGPLAHEPRREVQVVVMEEHGRGGIAVELV